MSCLEELNVCLWLRYVEKPNALEDPESTQTSEWRKDAQYNTQLEGKKEGRKEGRTDGQDDRDFQKTIKGDQMVSA